MKIVEQNQHRDVIIKEGEVEKTLVFLLQQIVTQWQEYLDLPLTRIHPTFT